MGLFTKTSGEGWSLDKESGRLTISGDLGTVFNPFEKIRKMVRSVVALEGARTKKAEHLFSNMKNLKSADLSKLDVSECTDLSWMFYECKSLTSIDVTGWDTGSVRDMNHMFSSCKSLVSVDLASLDLSSVETLQSMFSFCEKLSCVKMGSMSAAVKLADISNLFFSCKSFVELDLRSMDVTNVQDISSMFSYCSNLRTLDLSGMSVILRKWCSFAVIAITLRSWTSGAGRLTETLRQAHPFMLCRRMSAYLSATKQHNQCFLSSVI